MALENGLVLICRTIPLGNQAIYICMKLKQIMGIVQIYCFLILEKNAFYSAMRTFLFCFCVDSIVTVGFSRNLACYSMYCVFTLQLANIDIGNVMPCLSLAK